MVTLTRSPVQQMEDDVSSWDRHTEDADEAETFDQEEAEVVCESFLIKK